MHRSKRIKITDVNPHLICVLCGGYYVDATTIIECLHSFCKSCIVKYLRTNKYCPICDVQIHKSYPLLNIRRDKTLQNIVYKLVPSLFKDEMQRRSAFYEEHPPSASDLIPPLPEDRGEISESSPIFSPDELLVLCVEYQKKLNEQSVPKRYFHCPAAVTVSHITKLIRGKFNLSPAHHVHVFFRNDLLQENTTLMDLVYIYQCKRKVPIHLTYRILEFKKKTIKIMPPIEDKGTESESRDISEKKTDKVAEKPLKDEKHSGKIQPEKERLETKPATEMEWKEVQLQISENGVMSVRNMTNSECSPIPAVEAPPFNPQSTSPPTHPTASMTTSKPAVLTPSSSTHKQAPVTSSETNGPLFCEISKPVTTTASNNFTPLTVNSTEPILSVSKVSKDQVKKEVNNSDSNKLSISRISGSFKGKGEVLDKIVSKLSPNERVIGNTSVTIRPVLSNSPKISPSKPQKTERKPQQTIKYKTLTAPTKQWNPSIDRSTMLTLKQNIEMNKPPRFFKMRNMPRYLGNPSSGVKPMFGGGEEVLPEQKPRSPTKLPPPYTPGSPKTNKPYRDKNWDPRIPSPAHSGSVIPSSNPYHLLYSGFPGPFSNSDTSLLAGTNPELLRSMYASTAFHPSLPPSISMLFNPLHNLSRPPTDSPPTIQKVPRSKSPLKIDDKPYKPQPQNHHSPASTSLDSKSLPDVIKHPPKTEDKIQMNSDVSEFKPTTNINTPEKMDCEVPTNNNIPKDPLPIHKTEGLSNKC